MDRDVYGPDSHLAEWHRSSEQEEMDGFTVSGDPVINVLFSVVFYMTVHNRSCLYMNANINILRVQTLCVFIGKRKTA